MLIDWFTVIAQAINFLILVWLLKRFLYTPILNAIHQREHKIKSQIQDAESKLADAKEEKAAFHRKNESFERQRESLLSEAVEEAATLRKQLLEEARKEAGDLRARLEGAIREEQQHLSREIIERTQQEIFAIARKVLSDLASANLEEHITRVFIQQLHEVEEKALKDVLSTSSGAVIVRSAFELPQEQRREIEKAVQQITPGIDLRFEKAPQLISGIELSAGGYKVTWSIGDYLRSLEKKIEELLNQEEQLPSQPPTKPAPNESATR